jgi:predicted esterase
MLTRILALVAIALLAVPAASQDRPFPAGFSVQQIEGMKCGVLMPAEFDPAAEHSLLVMLHGNGGDENLAQSVRGLAERDFVVVAPKSSGVGWSAPDVARVRTIAASLKTKLRIGERRMHALGFSNGGWNLAPLAFDDELRFQSATWVAAGYQGGKPPKHAKKEMSVLALAGSEDGNAPHALATPKQLGDKVRVAGARLQPGLDHKWPDKLVPFFMWWIQAAEDRFTPGDCAAFEWKATPEAALEAAAAAKTGAFVYWWSAGDKANDKARSLQNDVLRDPLVQRFGVQLAAASIETTGSPETAAKAGVKVTPAIVVYDAAGKVKALLQDKIEAKALSAALRSVAPDKSLPKD